MFFAVPFWIGFVCAVCGGVAAVMVDEDEDDAIGGDWIGRP